MAYKSEIDIHNIEHDDSAESRRVTLIDASGAAINIPLQVDTEMPAANALQDGQANPTIPALGSMNHVYNGTNWDRARGNMTDGLLVNLGSNNDVSQSGTWNINDISGTISLPTGASTSAKQDTIIGHVDGVETLLGTIDSDTSTLASTVSGTEIQTDVITTPKSSTGTHSSTSVSTSSTAILSATSSRKGFTLKNNGSSTIFLNFGGTATTSNYPLYRGEAYSDSGDSCFTGAINGIVSSGSENIRVVEFT